MLVRKCLNCEEMHIIERSMATIRPFGTWKPDSFRLGNCKMSSFLPITLCSFYHSVFFYHSVTVLFRSLSILSVTLYPFITPSLCVLSIAQYSSDHSVSFYHCIALYSFDRSVFFLSCHILSITLYPFITASLCILSIDVWVSAAPLDSALPANWRSIPRAS